MRWAYLVVLAAGEWPEEDQGTRRMEAATATQSSPREKGKRKRARVQSTTSHNFNKQRAGLGRRAGAWWTTLKRRRAALGSQACDLAAVLRRGVA